MPNKITVVIADDHPVVREGLATVLGLEEDVEVVARASNGVEAVSQVDRFKPRVALMDLQMPEMDGVEAIRLIQDAHPDTGVIILTTYDTADYIFRGIEAGAEPTC